MLTTTKPNNVMKVRPTADAAESVGLNSRGRGRPPKSKKIKLKKINFVEIKNNRHELSATATTSESESRIVNVTQQSKRLRNTAQARFPSKSQSKVFTVRATNTIANAGIRLNVPPSIQSTQSVHHDHVVDLNVNTLDEIKEKQHDQDFESGIIELWETRDVVTRRLFHLVRFQEILEQNRMKVQCSLCNGILTLAKGNNSNLKKHFNTVSVSHLKRFTIKQNLVSVYRYICIKSKSFKKNLINF